MSASSLKPAPGDFRRALLGWYERNGRHGLPWRGDFSPYRVLVSEFMLQQTTVSTVIPYFHRFMEEFPALRDLAEAPVERVMEMWSGLGYYARARNLHAASRQLLEKHGGEIPLSRQEVEDLPGVGRYTAGALLSFAHDKAEALVDGNVVRVLSRLYGVEEDVKDPKTQEKIWALAWKLVPPKGARHFNSALMDLGAGVCRPSGPDCLVCPFFKDCWARRHGKEDALPVSGADRAKKKVTLHAGLIRAGDLWALHRRPPKGLYADMWEFPSVELPAGAAEEDVRKSLSSLVGVPVKVHKKLRPVTHVLTHREMTLHPWLGGAAAPGEKTAWFPLEEIGRMAVSSLTRKLLRMLESAPS